MVPMSNKENQLKTRVLVCASLAAAAAVASAPSRSSEPAGVAIGGVQYSPDSSYTYAGVLQPFEGGKLGEGWFRKFIASWLTYRYDTNLGGQDFDIRARAPGIEAGAGYAWKGDRYTLSLSAGVGYRHVRVKPVVPPDEETGGIWTFNPQFEGSVALAPRVEASALGSYAFGQESAYARARVAWKPAGTWFAGLQETYLKGRNYRINQHGIVVGTQIGNGFAIEASLGQSRPHNGDNTGYIAFGLSRVF